MDAQWFWMDRGSCRIYANYHFDISTLEGRLVYRTTEIHKLQKACINVKNKDDCLRSALRSARFPADNHTDRISSYPSEDGFNFDGINAPTPINQIKKVEKQN